MRADSESGEESCCSYLPGTLVPVFSPHRYGEVSRLLASAVPRSGLEAREYRSTGFVVAPDIDLPFALLPLPVARLVLAASGLGRVLHLAEPSRRWLFEDHSRSAPERP